MKFNFQFFLDFNCCLTIEKERERESVWKWMSIICAPSFSLVVLFLWTVGILYVCADLMAPIDIDFRGGSARSADPPVMARRTLGHTNCIRYSVLSFSIVFLNSPFDSPAWYAVVCWDIIACCFGKNIYIMKKEKEK